MKDLMNYLFEVMSALAMTSAHYLESQHLYNKGYKAEDMEKEGE